MKKSLLFSCAMAVALSASAATASDEVNITFESSSYHQSYFAGDSDWYTTINVGDYEFYFDIIGPETGLVSGKEYTLDDMIAEYSYAIDYTTVSQLKYASATYKETLNDDGSKEIEAHVVSTDGTTFNLTGIWAPSDEPEMIRMPEDLETIDCVLACEDLDYGPETFEARLAFDGEDVYLESCGYVSYVFQSTIKGTWSGNTLTFPANQCVGFGTTANYFIYGFSWDDFALRDIVFNYDEELAAYVCESEIVVTPGMSTQLSSYYEFISNVVLTPSAPVAIETVATEKQLPAKRLENGRILINAQGKTYDAAGLRVK